MNRFLAWSAAAVLVGGWALAGCNTLPPPLRTADGKTIEVITVRADDPAEVEAVTASETARADYRYRLTILKDYYFKVGNMDKLTAAEKELKNLEEAQWFRFLGVTVTQPRGVSLATTDERLLVEEALAARRAWMTAMSNLAALYRAKGRAQDTQVIERAQQRFDPVYRYKFFQEAEVPGPELRPTDVVPQADQIYTRALKLYEDGKGALGFALTTDYDKERQALVLFQQVVHDYPRSTKIALAAFHIGEIYKEYFNEDTRAVKWYERAWQWDSHLTEAARFQAAVVYDFRLKNPQKALELYRASLKDDPWRMGNREFAQDRIDALGGKGGAR